MRALYRVIILMCLLPTLALASGMEVLTLQNRSASEVLPVLRPLLEPGGVMTGINDQIILRASSANRAQIKAALSKIDIPARQLLIYVSQNRQQNGEQNELSGHVNLGRNTMAPRRQSGTGSEEQVTAGIRNGDVNANIRLGNIQRSTDQHTNQMLRVIDGGSAYIQTGVSIPIQLHQVYLSPGGAIISDSRVYRDIGSGFYAKPHVNGHHVTLEISPQQDKLSANEVVEQQRLYTTITTRLGEWTQIGGTDTQENHQNKALLGVTGSTSAAQGGVWIKVEEIAR
ncbi:MAG: secretin N-terminal domain-containing protein [Sulfuriferula sp.]